MASIIKADNIQKVSDGTNIIKKCGSTITLGSCGATISLAAGATQTGFGQTYSAVEYCTTAKTSPFTAAAGTGYFVNTTCGAVTVTLPASPTAGDVISLKDYGSTWQTNNVTLCNNGNKINGICSTTSLSTEGQSVTLIYVDATKGWQDINDSTSNISGATFMSATGGTETTCGNFKIHTFTSDGCFVVSTLSNLSSYNEVSYLVVAGGGGGGTSGCAASSTAGAGGGGGGFRENKAGVDSYTASPLNGSTPITVTASTYPITVGAGGAGRPYPNSSPGSQGASSIFSSITSAGGGGGGSRTPTGFSAGGPGGSGGGGHAPALPPGAAGIGNTPPVSPPQGNPGGGSGGTTMPGPSSTGGGGAGAAAPITFAGGDGVATLISPTGGVPSCSTRYYAGGGGGGEGTQPGGKGGGGQGRPAVAGTTNSGGAGGGSNPGTLGGEAGGNGGSGIVIIRYKFQ
jgi:hypothetical protein